MRSKLTEAIVEYEKQIKELEEELSRRPKSVKIEPKPDGRYSIEIVNCRGIKYIFTQPFVLTHATKVIEDHSNADNH